MEQKTMQTTRDAAAEAAPETAAGMLSFTRQNLRRWLVPRERWKIVEALPETSGTGLSYEEMANAVQEAADTLAPGQGMAVLSANRLGLKYFAGATPAGGREPVSDPGREQGQGSFTKGELKRMLRNAGIPEDRIRWYYPYPDLDLPTEVFSDTWLPDAKTFTENAWDVHAGKNLRWQLFDEAAAGRTVVREGLFGELANAFAAVVLPKETVAADAPGAADEALGETAGETSAPPDEPFADLRDTLPVYVRFSHQRDAKYAIQTAIYQDRFGRRRVEKTPLTEEAAAHLARMHDESEALAAQYKDTSIVINKNRWDGSALHLEYATGVNLQDLLEDLLAKGDEETFCLATDHYFAALSCTAKQGPFVPDEETERLLGPQIREAVAGEAALPVSDLDPVFSNVLLQEDGMYMLIDCEWTAICPVPVSYLFYRCLSRFFYAHPEAAALWEKLEKRYGITPEKKTIFAQAEAFFQARVKGDSVSIAEAMKSAGAVGLPLGDAVRYMDWERCLFSPAIRFVGGSGTEDAKDEEALRRQRAEVLRGRNPSSETPGSEPFSISRDEEGSALVLEAALPAAKETDGPDSGQPSAEAFKAGRSAKDGDGEDSMQLPSEDADVPSSADTGSVMDVIFLPCLLPGTLTVYEVTDDRGRTLPTQSPQAATVSGEGQLLQYYYLTSDPVLWIRPYPDSRSLRIRYAYDAVVSVGANRMLPLAGLRRNASADAARRNVFLSELVSLRLERLRQNAIQESNNTPEEKTGWLQKLIQKLRGGAPE